MCNITFSKIFLINEFYKKEEIEIMRYILISIVVAAAMAYMGKIRNKKHEDKMNDPTITPMNFVIRVEFGLMAILFWLAIIGGLAVFIGVLMAGDGLLWASIGILFGALGVWGILYQKVWQIEVIGNDIAYRNCLGRVTRYRMEDITEVKAQEVNNGYRYRFYSGNKKLFTIDETTDDVFLVTRLRESGVTYTEV